MVRQSFRLRCGSAAEHTDQLQSQPLIRNDEFVNGNVVRVVRVLCLVGHVDVCVDCFGGIAAYVDFSVNQVKIRVVNS